MPIDKSWHGYAKGKIPDLGFEWVWQDATPPDEPNRYPPQVYIPLGYEKKVLPRGWQRSLENKPLDLDIIFEKDVEIVLRDGVKIYVDIYRPADTGGKKIPIIVAYSPYGKGGSGANLMDVVPYRVYVEPGEVVEMNIGIWPMGVVYERGEGLRLQISGKTMVLPEWDNPMVKHQEPLFNRGRHNIHLGGEHSESYLLIPKV